MSWKTPGLQQSNISTGLKSKLDFQTDSCLCQVFGLFYLCVHKLTAVFVYASVMKWFIMI